MSFFTSYFLSPFFFAFLGLLPIVILLYFLKLRRTEIVIPSTFLWVKSLQDLTANSPFQRLRNNLLLLLQLLILLLIIIALARPFMPTETTPGTSYCVIIDNSASMQTMEGETSRLALAQDTALDMVDSMGRGDTMMVVSFAESAAVLCELTDDRYRLRDAIRSVQPSDTRTRIRDVMLIARSLSPDNPDIASVVNNLDLVLLSDGNLSDTEEVGARAMKMTFVQIGESDNNAGIVGLSVRRPTQQDADHQTFVQIHNESTDPLSTTLSLYFNDSMLSVEEVEIPPQEQEEVFVAHPDLGTGMIRVELDHEDDLMVDNRAWLALRPPTVVRVLVVTDATSTSGYFLKRALALDPRVELSAVQPSDFVPDSSYDLIVFDGIAPAELPNASLLFINAVPDFPGLSEEGTIESPVVLSKDPNHPVMRFLSPGNIAINEAIKISLPEGSKELLTTSGGPLIADISRNGQSILLVTFDIANSAWPLELSFPLFVQNVVSWAPRASDIVDSWLPTGSVITLPASKEATAEIKLPSGATESLELDPTRPVYFAGTSSAGVYEVTMGDEVTRHAVNVLSRVESAVTPADSLEFGRTTMEARKGPVKQNRELWRWFVFAAVAVLMGEWWVYVRRAWV